MARTVSGARVRWIEANPVFGGSGSQIQFPAELGGFFGLPGSPHLHEHARRGVIHAGLKYRAKKMDFHHNGVWRLNLPTTKQGLGGYADMLMVFEKTQSKVMWRLWLLKPRSRCARLLKRTCRVKGKVDFKRRDDGSKRQYGFF
jgi:hypothetical protein